MREFFREMTRFNRSARASLATAAVISAHTCLLVECRDYKYKVKHSQSTACCWILTQSRRPVSRTNGRRARGHGSRTGFPRERVRRPLRGDRPRESIPVGPPETPVVHPPNRPPSIHPSIHPSSPAQTPAKRPDPAPRLPPFPQSTKKILAPVRELLATILPSDGAHYWILLVTLLVCPALILYGHHLETRERKGKGGVAKPGSLRRTMKRAEAEMKAKKRD